MYHKSLVCTILSPAGPRKDRMLALLVTDDRAKLNPHYNLLQKMATGSLIKREFAKAFEDALEVHQKVKFSDGYTVLDKALIEHNITVLSRIYTNITFNELGNFLGISASQGEKIISKMISEKRVHAVLDQLHELVEFEEVGAQQLIFNSQIQQVCYNADSLVNDILRKYPDLQKYNTFSF